MNSMSKLRRNIDGKPTVRERESHREREAYREDGKE